MAKRIFSCLLLVSLLSCSTFLALGLTMSSSVRAEGLPAKQSFSQSEMLLGAGASWAANGGTRVAYVDWYDNLVAHPDPNLAGFASSGALLLKNEVLSVLESENFTVDTFADIPANLSQYNLVYLETYFACEPANEPAIRNYIANGGGLLVWQGAVCYLAYYSKTLNAGQDLSGVADWFGASYFTNTGGSAHVTVADPLGASLNVGDTIVTGVGGSNAGITNMSADSQVLATWDDGSTFAFTHMYSQGRVYWQGDMERAQQSGGGAAFVSISTSSTLVLGSMVSINGTLQDAYGNGLENETVVLYYTFSGVSSWYPISSSVTDSLGDYFVQWFPPATGYFTIKAEWAGNATYDEASNTTTLSTLAYHNQYVFSVESNSTLSGLAFNSTDSSLSFTASGPSGTTGYTKVTLAKSLAANPANIAVYLNGTQTQYSITSTDDSWLLTFNYTHSTHEVLVDLNTSFIPEFPSIMVMPLLVVLTLLAVVVLKRRKFKI